MAEQNTVRTHVNVIVRRLKERRAFLIQPKCSSPGS